MFIEKHTISLNKYFLKLTLPACIFILHILTVVWNDITLSRYIQFYVWISNWHWTQQLNRQISPEGKCRQLSRERPAQPRKVGEDGERRIQNANRRTAPSNYFIFQLMTEDAGLPDNQRAKLSVVVGWKPPRCLTDLPAHTTTTTTTTTTTSFLAAVHALLESLSMSRAGETAGSCDAAQVKPTRVDKHVNIQRRERGPSPSTSCVPSARTRLCLFLAAV